MAIFAGASAGAVIQLCCPHCGEVQARARAPKATVYACRKCGHPFTREEGRKRKARTR
jgi:rubredoxin